MTYEIQLEGFDENMKSKKKSVALKCSKSHDRQISLLIRNFKKLPRNKNYFKNFKKNKEVEDGCFECHEPGHIKANCPNLVEKESYRKKKKRAMKAGTLG